MNSADDRARVRISVVMAALTATAGAVDAVTFLGIGQVFAALTTGNLLLLGFGAARWAGSPIDRPAIALASFAAGVLLAHAVVEPLARRGRRWFVAAVWVEAAVIAAGGMVAVAGDGGAGGRHPAHAGRLVVALLAVAMGWRSWAALKARVPDMPTTVVQTSLTQAVVDLLPPRTPGDRVPRLVRIRRLTTVAAMFAGGLAGACLLRAGTGPALLTIAVFEACLAAVCSWLPRLWPAGSAPDVQSQDTANRP